MNRQELIKEIQRALEYAPESVLKEIFNNLRANQENSDMPADMARNLEKILKEDKELLEKLAK